MVKRHPMQAFVAGFLTANVMRTDEFLVREIRKCSADGFEIVLGSRAVLRVRVETVEMGIEDPFEEPIK